MDYQVYESPIDSFVNTFRREWQRIRAGTRERNQEPALIVVLPNGDQMRVGVISGFDDDRVCLQGRIMEGREPTGPTCLYYLPVAQIQLMVEVREFEESQRRIGFPEVEINVGPEDTDATSGGS